MNGFALFLLKFVRAVFDVRECPEPFGNNENSHCVEVNQVAKKVSLEFAPISRVALLLCIEHL